MVDKKKILAKVISKFYDLVLEKYVEPDTTCYLDKERFEKLSLSGCVVMATGVSKKDAVKDIEDEETEDSDEDDSDEKTEDVLDETIDESGDKKNPSDASPDDVDDLSAKPKKPKLGRNK